MFLNEEYFYHYGMLDEMVKTPYSVFFINNSNKLILTCNDLDFTLWDLTHVIKTSSGIIPKLLKIFDKNEIDKTLNYLQTFSYCLCDYVQGIWTNSPGVVLNEDEIILQNQFESDQYQKYLEKSLFSENHLLYRRDFLFTAFIDACRKNYIQDTYYLDNKQKSYGNYYSYYGYNLTYDWDIPRYPTIETLKTSVNLTEQSMYLDWIVWETNFIKNDNKSLIAPEIYFKTKYLN